jgi:hypothetical protein
MRNFAARTSLRFDREPREMDVWFMTAGSPDNAGPGDGTAGH